MVTEEDKNVGRQDADGILISVRLYLLVPCFTRQLIYRRKVLCSAAVTLSISVSIQDIRPSSRDTYLDLHGYRRPKHFSPSAELYNLSELTPCFELFHQHYLSSTCDVATAVGTEIPQGHSVTLQSTQASRGSCNLL
jgi:hypothetical protein